MGTTETWTNAYPYADPLLSDDGQIMVYLTDQDDAEDATKVRVAWASKNGGDNNYYDNEGAIDDKGCGDYKPDVAGGRDGMAVTWVRTTEAPKTEPGVGLSEADQSLMLNSAEIMVSVYDGSRWTTEALTKNTIPDLSPKVSANGKGGYTVTWRSGDGRILCRSYGADGWGAEREVYNGTLGQVNGMDAAMLPDGTAAVIYAVDTQGGQTQTVESGGQSYTYTGIDYDAQEIYVTLLKDDSAQSLRLTQNAVADENPQIAAVKFGEKDHFVAAWATSAEDGVSGSNLTLAAFDAGGSIRSDFVSNLSAATQNGDATLSSSVRFLRGADAIEDLAILWTQTETDTETDTGAAAQTAARSVVKAVRFYQSASGQYGVTGALDVAEMEDYTAIDSFDAYDGGNDRVQMVLLGTNYDAAKNGTTTVTLLAGDNSEPITLAKSRSTLYTASETFANKVEVGEAKYEAGQVAPGMALPMLFSVTNRGYETVTGLTIAVGDGSAKYEDLTLEPGQTQRFSLSYAMPDPVADADYTVTASFANEDKGTATGTLPFDQPGVGISQMKTVKEEEGERTVQLTLYNDTRIPLEDNGERQVKLGIYTDTACTQPVVEPIAVSELKMVDNGAYTKRVTIPLAAYLDEDSGELPESGVTFYAKAWIEKDGAIQEESDTANNLVYVTYQPLYLRRGEAVTINYDLRTDQNGSQVTVFLQNNHMSTKETGNLVATLLDENGDVLEQKQSYTGDGDNNGNVLEQKQSYTGNGDNNGLLTLTGEEKVQRSFSFSQKGASVQVLYSDLVIGANDAELSSLTFEGINGVSLSSFVYNATTGHYEYTVCTDDLTGTRVNALTKSTLAKASLDGSKENEGNALVEPVALTPGKTTQIKLTVANGSASKVYVLTVQNNGDPEILWPDEGGDATKSEYGTEVYYAGTNAVINLTATQPQWGALSYQWYSCDIDGENTKPLEDQTGSTLTVSATTDAGTYYYRCKVTRPPANGGTQDYWSSVATVQIKKATDNSVTLTGTTVTFDNQPHGLTSAEAVKTGSTLHYSTDGGATWKETAPTFTAVGVHTVQVYATHPNYEDTSAVTADVAIQEKPGTLFKLETQSVEQAFSGYPESIQTKYGSADGLETALRTQVTKLGVPKSNTQVYDVKLMFSLDSGVTWTQATADNFPAAGVTVKLPYPEGTSRYSYDYTLLHLISDPLKTGKTAGSVEAMDITLEEGGIRFTVDCLSPFALGWERRFSDSSDYTVAKRDAEHGSFVVSPSKARQGDTVTITAKPDEGYQVERVTVTTRNGREIAVKHVGKNTDTFKMPASAVYVEVVFKKTSQWTNPFVDVPEGAWFYDAVRYVNENGLMAGTGATTFAPDLTTTRATIVTILHRMEGTPPVNGGMRFTDADPSAWYGEAVRWAAGEGIVSGYTDARFGPDDTITREQVAAILYRYAQFKGYDTTAKADLSQYTDADQIGPWALEAVRWANAEGLINGTSATTLTPKGNATRAEIAAILSRSSQNVAK